MDGTCVILKQVTSLSVTGKPYQMITFEYWLPFENHEDWPCCLCDCCIGYTSSVHQSDARQAATSTVSEVAEALSDIRASKAQNSKNSNGLIYWPQKPYFPLSKVRWSDPMLQQVGILRPMSPITPGFPGLARCDDTCLPHPEQHISRVPRYQTAPHLAHVHGRG
jgi:hypothetical protein